MVTYAYLLPLVACVCATATLGAVFRGPAGADFLRGKRDPTRSMLFSGYVPGGGMSAFATSGDFYPYYRAHRPVAFPREKWAPQPAAPEQETKRNEFPALPPVKDVPQNTAEVSPQNPQEVNPQEAASEEKPWLTANEKPAEEEAEPSPPAEEQQPIVPTEDEASIAAVEPEESKKSKKKFLTPKIDLKPPQLDNEEDEEEEDDRPSGGNAAASFNAWFPIMLGMFPPSGYGGESGLGYSGYGASGTGSGTRPSSFTSVVANSVSHGRNGVASSHAVAYGGGLSQPPQAQAQQQQQLQPYTHHG